MAVTPRTSLVPPSTSGDPRVYQRATTAALAGLAIQVTLVLATGLAALWADSQAVYAAGWHMLGGLPIWIVLALLYHQHETERAQRLAADKLADDPAASAAIFGNLGDDLEAARRRLDSLYRYGLPAVSLLVATYLLVAGGVLVSIRLRAVEAATPLAARCNPVGLLFALAGIAFVAFVGGRWLAGYARQRDWQLLRGGASYLMSCFVVTAVVLAGVAAIAVADVAWPFEAMALVIPAVMVAIGLEILFTTLLESYRPRIPGEVPRPAFDSRVLGLLTAPESLGGVLADLISYQFGVEVSGSWLYRLLGSAITPLTLFGAACLLALSCVTIVGPDERGVRLRFGGMLGEPLAPGIHLKWPWPMETVEMHPVGQVQQLVVSSDLTGRSQQAPANLWTNDSDRDSQLGQEDFLAAPANDGAGVSLVSADVTVQYAVADLRTFLMGSSDPRQALSAIALRAASQFFATHGIDALLATGRTAGGPALRAAIQAEADRTGLGLDVVGVAITSLHPPIGSVSRAFHAQIGAMQERETKIQRARREAVEQLARVAGSVDVSQSIDAEIRGLDALRTSGSAAPAAVAAAEARIDGLLATARGEAAEMLHAARAYRWRRAVGERADGERFAGELLAFQASPDYYRTRRFLEVLAEGLSSRRKFVIAGDAGDTPVFRMDFSDPASAIDTLLTE
jgi:regulator of protease activity HflC (stomatin/prohibitin superfamily)